MIEKKPLVSVIVCVFNGERFLKEALDSVIAQDYDPIELIVVDDGSEDRSGEIASSMSGVACLRQRNRGPSAARNMGIGAASGELVTFLDADDVMLPQRISSETGYLLEHPETGCVVSRWEPFFEPESALAEWMTRTARQPVTHSTVSDPGDLMRILREGGVCAMIRTETLEKVGLFNEDMRAAEDVEWLFRVLWSGEVIVLDQILTRKRMHAENLTHDRDAVRSGWLHWVARSKGDATGRGI